jgi:single-stranded DNA-binding protein
LQFAPGTLKTRKWQD